MTRGKGGRVVAFPSRAAAGYLVVGSLVCAVAQASFYLLSGVGGEMAGVVSSWAFSQAFLIGRLLGSVNLGSAGPYVAWWAVYMAVSIAGWAVVERRRGAWLGAWRRAVLFWLGVQGVYSVTIAILIAFGVLHT